MSDRYSDLEIILQTLYKKDNLHVDVFVDYPSRNQIDITVGHDSKECVSAFIKRNTHIMEISMLRKCGDITGEYHLQKMIELASHYQVMIQLLDASQIEYHIPGGDIVRISLHMMNILETGKTWYERNGFTRHISEYDTFDYSPIDGFIHDFSKQRVKDVIQAGHPHHEEYEKIMKECPMDDDITIQSFIKNIKLYLKLTCPKGICTKPIFEFVKACSRIIDFLYNDLVRRYTIPADYLITMDKEPNALGKKKVRMSRKQSSRKQSSRKQ